MNDRDTFGGSAMAPPRFDPAPPPVGGTGYGSQGSEPAQETDGGSVTDQAKEKATQAMDTAKEKAGQVADQVSTTADAGLDKAATGLDKAAGLLRQQSEGMDDQGTVKSVATKAADRLDGASQYLQGKDSQQLLTDLESLVRQKPAQTLLVAAGIGFLLSKVVR